MIQARLVRFALPFVLLFASSSRVPAAEAPVPDRTFESGWSAEGYVDPAFEAERAQLAFDDAGHAISLWAGRLTIDDPFQILWSQRSGIGWTTAVPAFAPTSAAERLPQLSRAPDGTIWLAWLRDDNRLGSGSFRPPALMAARLSGGAWSLPETVAVDTPALNPKSLEVGFSILAVSHDEAWIAWGVSPDGDPFSGDRDLVSSVRSAAGWSAPVFVSQNPLTESRPLLVQSTTGVPTALYSFANAPSLMQAVHWTGAAWSSVPDDLNALVISGFDAAPDTNGAIRLIVDLREDAGSGPEYHLREFVLDATGFHPGLLLDSAPVIVGGENDPPDWGSVSLSPGRTCPLCASVANELVFRVMWVDFTQGGTPKVLSSLRNAVDFQPYELVGTSFETQAAFPRAVHDLAADQWLATWTAPPTSLGRRRAKFAFTQQFAGDIAIGGAYVAPDTVRVSVVCSGDAEGRAFRIYRMNWPAGQGSPPFSPPVPAAAVELAASPFPGPCPFQVDDLPGPGRWFYYLELEPQGSFPARSARSFNAAIVPDGGGGGEPEGASALRPPTPQPAIGHVALTFYIARPGHARILLRDLRGRIVRTFDLGQVGVGLNGSLPGAPVWSGDSDRGGAVSSGVYFETLELDGAAQGDPRRVVFFP